MNRGLAALVLLLAVACGGPAARKLARAQSRYDALDAEGLHALGEARLLLANGHAEEAVAAFEALRVKQPECVYLVLWQEEAEISARGLDAVWPGGSGAHPASAEQAAAIEGLRADWRKRAEAGGVVELLAAARLESDAALARGLLERAERLDAQCAWVPYARAFLAARENDWPEVERQIERSIALDPGHLPTLWIEAWTKARGGDPALGSATLAAWVERAQGDPRIDPRLLQGAQLDLAVLAVLQGEPKVAREWLDELEKELPQDARVQCARASVEQALGNVDEALAWAERAHASAPNALLPLVQQALLLQNWKKDPVAAEKLWGDVLAQARASSEMGALFERLRARVLLDRRALATTTAGPQKPETPSH